MTQTSSGKDDWATPQYLFNQLNDIFNFNLDVACNDSNAKCTRAFRHDSGYDGLKEKWSGRVWCNPPFSKKNEWIKKAHDEIESENCSVCVMILPLNSISAAFFHDYIEGKHYYQVLRNRVSFLNNGVPVNGNNTGTVVVYFMRKPVIITGEK